MTTQLDTQQAAVQRYLEFETALTPVGINRLVKSGAMTPAHAADLKSAYRKKQARKHALNFQAKKRAKEITKLQQTEVALVGVTECVQKVVHEAKDQMDAATLLHAQVSAELSTQEERLAAVRRRIAKLQAKATPPASVPSPAANKVPKTPKAKKAPRKLNPYNMFVKLHSSAIRTELGRKRPQACKERGATMKEVGKRWKALDAEGRAPYKPAADQHNAKMAAAQQQNQQATT
jgi:hypothetical protein